MYDDVCTVEGTSWCSPQGAKTFRLLVVSTNWFFVLVENNWEPATDSIVYSYIIAATNVARTDMRAKASPLQVSTIRLRRGHSMDVFGMPSRMLQLSLCCKPRLKQGKPNNFNSVVV